MGPPFLGRVLLGLSLQGWDEEIVLTGCGLPELGGGESLQAWGGGYHSWGVATKLGQVLSGLSIHAKIGGLWTTEAGWGTVTA